MKLKAVLKVLEEHGHPLTKASLYRAGIKNGFLTREPYKNTYRYVVNEAEFNKWLDKASFEVPDDLESLNVVAKKMNVPYTTLKSMCDRGELRSYNYGAGRGVTYVKLRDVEVAIGIHNQNN